MFDIVIKNGVVFDGSGSEGFRADVAISGDSIAKIGDLSSFEAKRVIDAHGRAVTPGFIDMHSHADCSLPMWPDAESALGQGITSCYAGHCGMSIAPVGKYWLEQCFESRAMDKLMPQFPGGPIPGVGRVVETELLRPAFREAYGEELDWSSFGEYLAHLARVGHGVNIAANVGHSQLRQQILGLSARRTATEDEVRLMAAELDRALEEGAFGFSIGLDYDTSMYADEAELVALMKVAATHDAVVTAHMRTDGDSLMDGFTEFLELGVKSGAKLHISHIYTIFEASEGDPNADIAARATVDAALALIERYRAKGLSVTWDYLGTQPAACFFFPELATRFRPYVDECGGKHAFAKLLENEWYRSMVSEEIRTGKHRAVSIFASLSRKAGANWGESLIINRCSEKRFEHRSIGDIAKELTLDPVDAALEIMRRDPDTLCDRRRSTDPAAGHFYVLDEAMSFGTDNGVHNYDFIDQSGSDMPSVFGTPTEFNGMVEYFTTFRELPFEALIKRMTGNAARAMRVGDRGFIREGMKADMLIIDRASLKSNLSLTEPRTAPDGIDYVFVNGKVAVESKKHLHARSGAVIRRK